MKKVLYGIFAISALAATSAWAAPVQVGEAAKAAGIDRVLSVPKIIRVIASVA